MGLERVLQVSAQLARSIELDALLGEVVEAARDVLAAERGSVFLYEPETATLVTRVATGERELRVPADRGFVGDCVRTRAIVNVPDAYADPRFNPEVDRKTGFRTRGVLTLPLLGHDGALVGVLQVLNKIDGDFTADDESVGSALAAVCAVAIQRARMTEELVDKKTMERELAVAREIQTGVLPRTMPVVAGYEVAGRSRPASQTGGDIYDVVAAPGGMVLLLGDATGHGVGPALSVTQVRAMLRMALRLGAGIDAAFAQIDEQLGDDLSANRFVAAVLGSLDAASHRFRFHAGGQGPTLHVRAADGAPTRHDSTTMPMGMMPGIATSKGRSVDLGPGDLVALVTDGIFEYENAAGEAYGIERTERVLARLRGEGAERTVAGLFEDVDAFAAGAPQADDMTVVVLRRLPG